MTSRSEPNLPRDCAIAVCALAVALAAAGCTPPAITALNEGTDASTQGRYEEALKHYDHAIELDPKWSTAHCARGEVLSKMKRYKEATLSFRQCTGLNPRDLEGKASLAIALLLDCDYSAAQVALDDFDKAKSAHPRVLENAEWVRVRLKRAAALGGRCLTESEVEAL